MSKVKSAASSSTKGEAEVAKSETEDAPDTEEETAQIATDEDLLASNGYTLGKLLGKNRHVKIFKCSKEDDSGHLVVKIIEKILNDQEAWNKFLKQDNAVSNILKEDNIVTVLAEFETPEKMFIIMRLQTEHEHLLIYLGVWPTVFYSIQQNLARVASTT